ncbi:hypothetical protein [Phyllobacterium sophorae]|uniref:Uncharacterized protein n=1 Tax=Phyllobacterium sophorae TaxID=1520277 RepID=A0A2P7B331_9HYPH|nr:hypothetical protein [Phyllobacterium sophorae]PSH60887.1 hypothetical protein CU103_25325 [Phyllobacterium sophorae]
MSVRLFSLGELARLGALVITQSGTGFNDRALVQSMAYVLHRISVHNYMAHRKHYQERSARYCDNSGAPRSAFSETEIADYLSTISASGIHTDEARYDADFVPYHCADFPEADEAAIRRFLGLVHAAVRMVEEQRQRADTRAKLTVIEGGRHATPRS